MWAIQSVLSEQNTLEETLVLDFAKITEVLIDSLYAWSRMAHWEIALGTRREAPSGGGEEIGRIIRLLSCTKK